MKKFTLIAGPCAIEDFDTALNIAKHVKAICQELDIHYIFKASYKKANRSKLKSFTELEISKPEYDQKNWSRFKH